MSDRASNVGSEMNTDTGKATESYERQYSDPELHCMHVMMEALRRHLLPEAGALHSENEYAAAIRAVEWLRSRVTSLRQPENSKTS